MNQDAVPHPRRNLVTLAIPSNQWVALESVDIPISQTRQNTGWDQAEKHNVLLNLSLAYQATCYILAQKCEQ